MINHHSECNSLVHIAGNKPLSEMLRTYLGDVTNQILCKLTLDCHMKNQ